MSTEPVQESSARTQERLIIRCELALRPLRNAYHALHTDLQAAIAAMPERGEEPKAVEEDVPNGLAGPIPTTYEKQR